MCSSRRSFGTGSENGCLALFLDKSIKQSPHPISSLYRDRSTILWGYDFFKFPFVNYLSS